MPTRWKTCRVSSPHDGGLIASTRSQILFLKDTDGDNKADLIKHHIHGFNPKHSLLVTRYKIEPNRTSLKATRVGDRTEFFRTSDEWSRTVNFTAGSDGAIYICDIYRCGIDHARIFPEEFVKTHDMRQGENQDRIWPVLFCSIHQALHFQP